MVRRHYNVEQDFEIPLTGIGVVILSIICFLIFLWLLIIIMRVVLG